jgi:hypothetical protein
MTLQDVADKIDAAQTLTDALPESPEKDAVFDALTETYQTLVAASGDLLVSLSDIQDAGRSMRLIMDAV